MPPLVRILFLPEFGRTLAAAGRAAGRVTALVRVLLTARGCRPDLARLREPATRRSVGLGAAVAAAAAAILFAGLAIPSADPASAQTIDPGIFGEEDDATRRILGFLSDFDVGDRPVLGDMLFAFNTGVMVLAGFLLIWHAVTGTVDTAREGRFGFGSWEILRIVTAVALMAPLPGGMNGAQHAVVGLAKLGGDFANAVWRPFSANALGRGDPIVPHAEENAWRTAIARVLVSETCRHVANQAARAAGDAPYVTIREGWHMPRRRGPESAPGTLIIHYDGARKGMPKDLCGAIRFDGLRETGGRGIAARGHRQALRSVLEPIRRVAADLGNHYLPGAPRYGSPLPDAAAALDRYAVARGYETVLQSRLKEAADSEHQALIEAVAADADRISWLSAASFFNTIAAAAAVIQAAAHNIPTVSLPSPRLEKWAPQADAAVKGLVAALAQSPAWRPLQLAPAASVSGALAPSGSRGGDLIDGLMEFINPSSVLVADSGNPIVDLTNMGFGLINSSLVAIAALSGASVGNNLVETLPFIGKGLDVFEAGWQVADGFVTLALTISLVAGVTLAYFLPAIPFIRFLIGILTWLIAVVEAVLAVTILAAAHVSRAEGNQFIVSATRQGWLFLPGLILRPALMLFGLIIGYFVFLAGIELLNATWIPRMKDANAAGSLGPIDFLAMLALYVMIAYALINSSFKLIDALPNVVLEWIGGRSVSDDGADRIGAAAVGGAGRLGALRMPGIGGGRAARAAASQRPALRRSWPDP